MPKDAADDNPYAPPQTDLHTIEGVPDYPPAIRAVAWRDGTQLVLGEGADLSARCSRCGCQAERKVRLILADVEGNRTLWVGLCPRHSRGRGLYRNLLITTLVAITLGSGWLVILALRTMAPSWTIGVGLVAFMALVVIILSGEQPLITVEGVEVGPQPRPLIRLGGLHPCTLEGLDEWPGLGVRPG